MDFLDGLMGSDNSLYEEIIRENLNDRGIVLNGGIDASVLEDVVLRIMKFNKEDRMLPKERRKPIKLYINSAGGEVFAGNALISAIESSTTPVHGICLGYAASTAYNIYICCHERIAFPGSILLQHDGEIGVQNSTNKAKQTMKFFDTMEERTKQHVLKYTSMTEEFYDEIQDQEYWMYADDQGKKLGCVDKIIGQDCTLDYIL